MSRDLGPELPPRLLRRLAGDAESVIEDTAVPICTVDDEGFPHAAMLTYAQLEAVSASAIRATVYGSSGTARHLRRDGRATLLFVDPEGVWYVKVQASPEVAEVRTPGGAAFVLGVHAVTADAVDQDREAAAAIVSGIRFRRTGAGS